MIFMRRLLSVLLVFVLATGVAPAQKPRKIRLVQADVMAYDKAMGDNVQRIIGNAVFEHDGAFLYCDSAHLNNVTNSVKAYSRVHIKSSDTLNLYGDSLYYSGETRIAQVFDNVKLIDNRTILTTNRLTFDRNTGIAYYLTGGHIVNDQNTLDSKRGYYHTNSKDFFFRDDVLLTNPDYVINCDTLQYNTQSKVSRFKGPTTIRGEETDIYAENGWYNTDTDIAEFEQNARIRNGDQELTGDSIYYERRNGFGEAFNNIMVIDTVQNLIATGQYARYLKQLGYTLITDRPEVMMPDKNDTLFLHADTLKATFDSAQKTKEIFAYYRVKFYRTDLQGMADSLIYKFSDSTMRMLGKPALWTEGNQMTSDSIHVLTAHEKVQELRLFNNAFIIASDTLGTGFNQIKGRNMNSYFIDNELVKIVVTGNAESLYWVREDDGSLTGINKAYSSNMIIRLRDKKIKQIVPIEKPNAVLYPENELSPGELLLKDFHWLNNQRPKSRQDIFIW